MKSAGVKAIKVKQTTFSMRAPAQIRNIHVLSCSVPAPLQVVNTGTFSCLILRDGISNVFLCSLEKQKV